MVVLSRSTGGLADSREKRRISEAFTLSVTRMSSPRFKPGFVDHSLAIRTGIGIVIESLALRTR